MSQGDIDSEYGDDNLNFWYPKQYMRTVKRFENSNKLCHDLTSMVLERAEIEKQYSSNLKKWSSKWINYLESGAEYGSAKHGWQSLCNESLEIADIHSLIRTQLLEETQPEINKWRKEHYHKATIPTQPFKEVKALETEFEYTQKPWTKKLKKSNLLKKEYHSACKQEKSLNIQLQNAKNDTSNPDQNNHDNQQQKSSKVDLTFAKIKKLEEKLRKTEKEVEKSKASYQASLHDLEGESGRYMEEMEKTFKKAQTMEQERIEFFKQEFEHIRLILNISKGERLKEVYENCQSTINQMNSDVDLKNWSMTNGAAMVFVLPTFEEYVPELSGMTKNRKPVPANSGIVLKNITTVETDKRSDDTKSTESLNDVKKPVEKTKLPSYDECMNPFSMGEENESEKNNHENEYVNNTSIDSFYDSIMVDDHQPGVKVRALYDYKSQEEDELNLTAGQIFEKLEEEDEQGWCKGRCNGIIGLYPANYADPI